MAETAVSSGILAVVGGMFGFGGARRAMRTKAADDRTWAVHDNAGRLDRRPRGRVNLVQRGAFFNSQG